MKAVGLLTINVWMVICYTIIMYTYYRAYVAAVELPFKFFRNPSPLSLEWIRVVECTSDVLTGCPTLEDLGVTRLVEFELTGGKHAYL